VNEARTPFALPDEKRACLSKAGENKSSGSTVSETRRNKRLMYYFRFQVHPTTQHPKFLELGGATANVVVDMADPVLAASRARQYLAGQLWKVASLEQTGQVRDRAEFDHDKLLVDLYQQALDHGISCLMVAYPIAGEKSENTSAGGTRSVNVSSQSSPKRWEGKSDISKDELDRRAILIAERYSGINPPCEAFYIWSVMYSAGRAREAFERFAVARAVGDTNENQVSTIHEALGHAGSLSRFFWPSEVGGQRIKALKVLKTARAKNLREAFGLTDDSPLRDRRLRDFLEHFDERLDEYLLRNDAGHFFPSAMVGDQELADDPGGHIFKLVDPTASCFILLGVKHFFGEIRKEVYRIYELALEMDSAGCKLRRKVKGL
jgi:hypothetical protein